MYTDSIFTAREQKIRTRFEDWKRIGNNRFSDKEYETAENTYTLAVNFYREQYNNRSAEMDDENKLLLCQIFTNRSAARFVCSTSVDEQRFTIQVIIKSARLSPQFPQTQ